MIRTLSLCAFAFGLFGLVSIAPQPAEAGCYKVSRTSHGLFESLTAGRATRQLTRAIKRDGYGRVGPVNTSCGVYKRHKQCTAWARACR